MDFPDVVRPLEGFLIAFNEVLPGLIAALVILLIGYLVARLISKISQIILYKSKINEKLADAGIGKAIGKTDVASVISLLVRWYIIIIFLHSAIEVVNLGALSTFMARIVDWLPNLLIAVVVLLTGVLLGHYVSHALKPKGKKHDMPLMAVVLKWVIIFLAVIISLQQIGINVSVLEKTFLIILAGIMLAIAIALGIGGKDVGKRFIKKVEKSI